MGGADDAARVEVGDECGGSVRRAARTDDNQAEIVAALRKIGATVQPLHTVGKGCPDLLVCFRRKLYLMEIKDGAKPASERRLTDDQARWIGEWGGPVQIVKSPEDAIASLMEAA